MRIWIGSSKKPVVLLTDHQSTAGVVNQKTLRIVDVVKLNPRLMASATYLSQYNLDVRHIPGKLNLVPDALSRLLSTDDDRSEPAEEHRSELDDIFEDAMFVPQHPDCRSTRTSNSD